MERGQAYTPEQTYSYEVDENLEAMRLDATTWAAEALSGTMRTSFEFRFDGNDFYGQDGRAMKQIFKDAIVDARRIALSRPELAFELRRRQLELDELHDMIAMGRGELPNTMVVVSDFPPELQRATSDVGGYNVTRKQTMLRVITMQPDGKLTMTTQSLDKSDREGLEDVYLSLGYVPAPGELLGQRMHMQMTPEEQERVTDQLTAVYDRSLQARDGQEYYAGRIDSRRQNTYDFVSQQTDLIDAFVQIQRMDMRAAEDMRYELAAALDKRFSRRHEFSPIRAVSRVTEQDPFREMIQAGREAQSVGKTFSGCGATTSKSETTSGSAEQGPSGESDVEEAGYGNKSEATMPAKIKCVNCKEKVSSKEVVKAKSWCCPKCKYEVDICTGKVLCGGNK